MPTPRHTQCAECQSPVTLVTRNKINAWMRSGRAYCDDRCRDTWVRRDASQRMARTNRVHASARMLADNPMSRPEPRAKMRATLREIGHQPAVRGGNGAPTPEPHRRLAEYLGWPIEVVVAPGDGLRPYHYKVDIAHPTMKVAVEVDGGSHYGLARQASDQRRDVRLGLLGWLTFRFSNQDAMERTAECVAMVLSTTSKWQARTPTK